MISLFKIHSTFTLQVLFSTLLIFKAYGVRKFNALVLSNYRNWRIVSNAVVIEHDLDRKDYIVISIEKRKGS